ncbi:hypothetical protein [Actinomadura madurae]|uniref:hypothetical protein n=1 Tax=Actinomadura madurae TaxID=1993 RepID=UPI0020D20732|nr:hypothetical protein [Actinomadura madurae]MCQ0017327.1 hypothetical protein [Actinomadura madurae]
MRAVHRRLLLVGTVATCLGAAATFPVLADDSASLVRVTAAEGTPVPGQYIVTLKSGASPTPRPRRSGPQGSSASTAS